MALEMSDLDNITGMSNSQMPYQPMLYRGRWFILAMFCCCSMSNSYHWIHLNIISDRVLYIWNVSIPGRTAAERQLAVDTLSIVYMIAYIPLIIPATWMLDRHGLRITIILATCSNALGGWIKCVGGVLAVDPNTVTSESPTFAQMSAFPVLLVGQIMDAVAQVFILGIPSALAVTWFGELEISTATALGVLANQLGTALGFCIPPMIVASLPSQYEPTITPNYSSSPATLSSSPSDASNDSSYQYFHQNMMYLLYIGAAINTLPAIPVLCFFKNEPPTEPTLTQYHRKRLSASMPDVAVSSAETLNFPQHLPVEGSRYAETVGIHTTTSPSEKEANNEVTQVSDTDSFNPRYVIVSQISSINMFTGKGFKGQLLCVLGNGNFTVLLLSYGVTTGLFYALGTLLNVILQVYFPGNAAIGWIGFTMIISGMVGSILIGVALDRTRRYRLISLLVCGVALVWMGAFTGLVLLRSLIWMFFAAGFIGFALTGFLMMGFDYAAELTYPANEGLTSGLINASAQIFGILFLFTASHLASSFDVLYTNIFFTGLSFFGFFLLIFVKEDLRRSNLQKCIQSEILEKTIVEMNR
ncbi:feline leukemia virus subgroup C receptor-related protein 1 [Clonorchis sinensis]|uniref:Feline leukemia virus subgroup C receptor-related protein 1 n=1 Tax=Clonorchis sinensis TaxID=79923 RepID=G7YVC0_CLOSI|nr:feline leukemia virus subgroup C receptor-related protein 1 [Clonorchis sinensis]